tara:strand:+ start:250 stop:732 length:483 start_codon:yes stop_codon:yes gene_type:complete
MKRTVTELFAKLGAPLANKRWSWGAIRSVDRNIILRVWADQIGPIRKKIPLYTGYPPNTLVCYIGCHDRNHGEDRLGWNERKEHIELIKGGAGAWGVQCKAKIVKGEINDEPHQRRKIQSVDSNEIWKMGEVFLAEDPYGGGMDYWVTMTAKPSLKSATT